FFSISTIPSTCPGCNAARGYARFSTSRPVAGADTSKVAPPTKTSTNRSPSKTTSPGSANHTLSMTGSAPSSGRMIGACMAVYHLVRMITGPHEGTAGHLLEPQRASQDRQGVKLLGRHITFHRNVLQGGCQILSQSQGIAVHGPQVSQDVEQLLGRLSESQHQAALGDDLGRPPFDTGQQVQTP